MTVGIVVVRPLGQAGEQGALLELESTGGFSEIASCRQLDAPGASAEINRIEIELEDFILAERALEARRHDHLADLALIGEVLAHQEVLHDLLGDGRAALRTPAPAEVADEGADQAALVHALVLIEALVLGRDEGVAHVLRDIRERDPDAPLVLLEHLGEAPALAVEHDAGARKLEALELAGIRQVGGRLVVEIDDVAEVDDRGRDLRARAELPIGGMQVGKIDAAERLLLADRLRIVQRGRDQLIEVDVLDVEGLAHMGAAGAQQLRHLLLVLGAVELRLHRLGRGRDLTECESGSKDLDEDRFHRARAGLLEIVRKSGRPDLWCPRKSRSRNCGSSIPGRNLKMRQKFARCRRVPGAAQRRRHFLRCCAADLPCCLSSHRPGGDCAASCSAVKAASRRLRRWPSASLDHLRATPQIGRRDRWIKLPQARPNFAPPVG